MRRLTQTHSLEEADRSCWSTTVILSAAYALMLFSWSLCRHYAFRSEAFDLGIFDQALWLMSHGENVQSSLLGRPILGDHFSLILYPISWLYLITPSVEWLFAIQAICLSLGAPILFLITKQFGANARDACFVSLAYLCHPAIININLFDFHPDSVAVPFILLAVLTALKKEIPLFVISIGVVLACKEILALAVIGLGVFLFLAKQNRKAALGAIFSAGLYFFIVVFFVIPYLNNGTPSAGIERYGLVGTSPDQLLMNYLLHPSELLSRLHPRETAYYLRVLFFPYFFALYPTNLLPLIGAVPLLFLNIISDLDLQRTIKYQHSLTILPFLSLIVVYAVVHGRMLIKNRTVLSLFLVLYLLLPIGRALGRSTSDFPHPWRPFPMQQDSLREAVALVPSDGVVAAPSYVVPHLSHRARINIVRLDRSEVFDFIVVNTQKPGIYFTSHESRELVKRLKLQVEQGSRRILFEGQGIFVFGRAG